MIVELEEARLELIAMRSTLKELGQALRIDSLTEKAKELEEQTLDPEFWNNQENSSKVLQQLKQAQKTIEDYKYLCQRLEDAIMLADMGLEEKDESVLEEVRKEKVELSGLRDED